MYVSKLHSGGARNLIMQTLVDLLGAFSFIDQKNDR